MIKKYRLSLLFLCFSALLSCSKPEVSHVTTPSEFAEYISGYTSGQISSEGEIAVTLNQKVARDKQAKSGLFKLNPAVSGKPEWVSDKTVVFKPERNLKSGQKYHVAFQLGKLVNTGKDKSIFKFDVSTIRQDLEIEFAGLESESGDRSSQRLSGTVYTADATRLSSIKRVLKAEQEGQDLEVNWEQDGNPRRYKFQISGIKRQKEESELNVSWDGTPIGSGTQGKKVVDIAPVGAFELLNVQVFRDENPRVELTFSDPLDPSQNLDGLVRLEKQPNLNFIINGNKLTINPQKRKNGVQKLFVDAAIKNTDGKKLGTEFTREIQFFQPKPQVALLGKGVIIPRSNELLFPFKAVSLGAVDVRVTRIFESNIGQFLQENKLNESDRWNLNRVGRPIYHGVVPLSKLGSVDVGEWNNYALDLSKLINPEPGAIYKVELGFRKHEAVYPCGTSSEISNTDLASRSWELPAQEEQDYWDSYDRYYYPPGYDWKDRQNACTASYYNYTVRTSRNVLASDLGLIAKQAEGQPLHVFVTDLRTAEPKSGVDVKVYDFQQQEMSHGTSDAEGKVQVETPRDPFYLVASEGDQKGYLKLDDGDALSVSDFDVSGKKVRKGIKGFLYGERGVWRPGDSLFVTLILEDKNNVLPDDDPVTFELNNPSGQVVNRQTFTNGLNGFYAYQFQTEEQAPTGNWRLDAKIGGLTFSKTLKIESVKPNRLKVVVHFAKDKVTASPPALEAELSSRWLHGAIAKNLKADVEMSMRATTPDFGHQYPDFSFYDESVSFSSKPESIFKGKLDEHGKAKFTYHFSPLSEGPARVLVNLRTRVYEPSGNFSIGRSSTYYYPFRTIVGIKPPKTDESNYWDWLDRDAPQPFEVVSVDADGNPAPFRNLKYEIYHIQWRWWWERGHEDLSSYFEKKNVERVQTGAVQTGKDGKGSFHLKLPDNAQGGRYLVRVIDPKGGHSASTIVYFSWYGGKNESVSPARLTFSSDKKSYKVGEDISLTIPSSKGSRILVSLESGSKVLSSTWIDGKDGETVYTFPADQNMTPNVYAHVMHIQPHGQQNNDLPIRMYGVIPISVENPGTTLHPEISLPAELHPESTVQVDVSEKDGKAMTYTIAMVDEGLLDLTNFKTPAPHEYFYTREALGVKTWDLYEYVSDAYGGNLSRILAIGGDASEKEVKPLNQVSRFEPMVRFAGPFHLKKGETNRHKISIPNYVGSVRTMVIAGEDGAYGKTEATTPVRKPVMVLATLPRVLGPGETVSLPVSVFAMKENVKDVQVRVETNDMFEFEGDHTATVHFNDPGDKLVNFKLKTKSQIGVGKVRVEAASGSESAFHEIEIAVRNPNSPFVDVKSKIVKEGENWSVNFDPPGMIGTNSAMLEVSRIPPIDFGKRLKYLLQYPYGCIEQTTSSVFPQLYLSKVMDLSAERKAEIQKNVDSGIKRMEKFVTFSGGLAYWPGDEDPNSWGTNYGYHFLLEAQKQGYYVPSNMLDRIRRFQQERARNWSESNYHHSDLIQAYRLYTLSLANTPELGAMNRLREKNDLTLQARWRLAAAYALAGQKEAASKLVEGVSTSVDDYRELSGSFGSALRDRAMILETLSLMGRQDKGALIVRDISSQLSSQRWLSTQTTAYSLIAISKFMDQFKTTDEMNAAFSLNGKQTGKINSNAVIVQTPINMDENETNKLKLDNKSKGTLYARLILEGTPLIGDTLSSSNSLVQKVRYTNLNGESIDPTTLNQGTDFVAEVTVSNPGLRGNYEHLALAQVFPSGWEIRNSRMDDESFKEPTASFEYQDIRDDRVYTYFYLPANSHKTFRVQLNASYIGRFYLPAVTTGAMYDKTISARSAGKWVEVKAP